MAESFGLNTDPTGSIANVTCGRGIIANRHNLCVNYWKPTERESAVSSTDSDDRGGEGLSRLTAKLRPVEAPEYHSADITTAARQKIPAQFRRSKIRGRCTASTSRTSSHDMLRGIFAEAVMVN